MNLTLTDADKIALRKRERAADDSDLHFRVCPCCALADWIATYEKREGETHAELGEHPCQTCSEVFYRHPEIARWVMRVVTADSIIQRMLPKPAEPSHAAASTDASTTERKDTDHGNQE